MWRCNLAGGGQAGTLTVTGEDVTKAMDMQDFSGLPFPAVPVEGRAALLRQVRALRPDPHGDPGAVPDVQIPIDKIPAQRARIWPISRSWRDRWAAMCSTSSRARPWHQHRHFGPRSLWAYRSRH